MPETPLMEITRKQLYDEIWDISAAGVARKYDIPYGQFIQQVKNAGIPIPPSGYWTKLGFGKPVEKPSLPEPADSIIQLYKVMPRPKKVVTERPAKKENIPVPKTELESSKIEDLEVPVQSDTEFAVIPERISPSISERLGEPETYEQSGHTYNVYNRESLYKEVWEFPVTEVAKKYRVSDVAIHKICKSLDIPTPPPGYWAKLRAGKPVTQVPLAESTVAKKTGVSTGIAQKSQIEVDGERELLSFLSDEDKSIVLSVATQIRLPDDNAKMHSKVISHRKKVIEWQNQLTEREAKGWGKRNMESPPLFADSVSAETLPRVCHIIDTLIKAMEPLGCSLTDDMHFIINGEKVSFTVSESKDEVKHIPTREENMQLLKYEEEKRRYSWASKPNIRKYDHPYNGRICLSVNSKSFRDCKSYVVEERLGDIMIEFYEASDGVRKDREAREEAERKRKEAERLREERRERYNDEVERTQALLNVANDYEIACRIRRFIAATEQSPDYEKPDGWVEWARAKADWYDPTISRDDEFFGVRNHENDSNFKELKKRYY